MMISVPLQEDPHSMGGPWNSNIVSTLQQSDPGCTNNTNDVTANAASDNGITSKKQSSNRNANAAAAKRSSKSKSKLSRVRYFLHPGEPPVGQIVSDSLTDGQDNNNTLSLKQPQVNVYYYLPICRYLVLLLLLIQGMTLQIVSIWVFWYLGVPHW